MSHVARAMLPLVLLGCFCTPQLGGAQPSISKRKIPEDLPRKVDDAIRGLYASDPVARAKAVGELRSLGEEAKGAVPFLTSMLHDGAPLAITRGEEEKVVQKTSPAMEAIRALGAIGDAAAVEPLIACLQRRDADVRALAADALGEIGAGAKAAIEPLKGLLDDRVPLEWNWDRWIHSKTSPALEAIEALGQIGDESVAPSLQPFLGGPSDYRLAAIGAIGRIGGASMAGPLIALFGLPDESSRSRAVATVAGMKVPIARYPLLIMLADEDKSIRSSALDGLLAIADEEVAREG